ncbi:hypothetical protein BCU70_10060 [Vibrio sp. 10N.286.49.C2]|uniref:DUF413 domain-containing protein n=1 Tax=unclassified Vibrio TaxID=2614977 RepID=UPI000C84C96A|nr:MULTISPECIES: DUF413 domain-containing protein [unclassified Vibrio]PMH26481.1 hypothetical protein BCU70_10060 [Vibrio sp. 10N.286.49.C2]PMH54795.1 hypothetical protein BCU66_10875 [Vibrio sp. 10N.286.49.B1]PMH83971.1 hypothetical protein BCU58_12775 [Vibrio sp. 10N.286.48.B7]
MSDMDFRLGKRPFYDNKKFRRGFAKSGDFTLAEEEILIRYGDTMNQLECGDIAPETDLERHFLLVTCDEKKAETKLEKAWIKYTHLARDRRRFHTLNGKKLSATESESQNDDDYQADDSLDEPLARTEMHDDEP